MKAALPKIKTFSVMAVASPDSRDSQGQSTDQESDQHYSALKDHFDGRSVLVLCVGGNRGEIKRGSQE